MKGNEHYDMKTFPNKSPDRTGKNTTKHNNDYDTMKGMSTMI